jgi:hypothetical protein
VIPNNAMALIALLVTVSPGYVYQRTVERRVIRRSRAGVLELIDMLCIGALCTVLAAIGTVALGRVAPSVFLKISELPQAGQHLGWRHVASLVSTLALASGLALAFGTFVVSRANRAVSLHGGSVWTATFLRYLARQRGGRRSVVVVAQLRDGPLIGGQLQFADMREEAENRDIALAKPLFLIQPGSTERQPLGHDFIILPGHDIAWLYGKVIERNEQVKKKLNTDSGHGHAENQNLASGGAPGRPRPGQAL